MTDLEKIQKRINSLSNKLSTLYEERNKIEMSDKDYRGKCFYHRSRGYIYVQSQFVYGKEFILQGFVFNSSISPYSDDFYYSVDALREWRISFDDRFFENELTEITKEEFVEAFNKDLDEYRTKVPEMLEYCLTNKEVQNEE
jgi:hypothetical protein